MHSTTNRRRSTRNRRNRQPQTPPVPGNSIVFSPKTKYRNSHRNADGVFVLSKRKRPLLTEPEKTARKQKKLDIQCHRQSLIALSHQAITLCQFGMHTEDFPFGPHNSKKIIEFLQATYDQYREIAAAKSFFFRALKRHRTGTATPHLEPHRDKRSEHKGASKRKKQ